MADSLHEFVADEAWLAVAILTIPFVAISDQAGLAGLADAFATLGFVVLTPIFLFWGEQIADAVVGAPPEQPGADGAEAGDRHSAGSSGEADPIDELKQRYAAGEIDELEFERRVERVLALDGVDADDADVDALLGEARGSSRGDGAEPELDPQADPKPDPDADPELNSGADPTVDADVERER